MSPDLSSVLTILEKLVWPLIAWVGWELRTIRTKLAEIERNQVDAQSWRKEHDKQDDERHVDHDRRLRQLEWRQRVLDNGDVS